MIERMKFTDQEIETLLKSMVILIDSMEKKNKHITEYFDKKKIPYMRRRLDFGDYSFCIPANKELGIDRELTFEREIAIERKNSAEELSSCFTKTRSSFEEEFNRAKGKDAKIYLLVEDCSYEDIVNGNYGTEYNSKSYLGSLHSFDHKYNVRISFMKDRNFSAIFIYGVLRYYLRSILK